MSIKIVIDQGHNPSQINAGASFEELQEANITYQVGSYLAQLLENDPRFEVKVTRENENTVLGTTIRESLQTRVDIANQWEADYFLSIHVNANNNHNINGTEVYLYNNNNENEQFAQDIIQGIVNVTAVKDNGVRFNPSLYVLRNTTMKALLIELAYLTNPENREILRNDPNAFALGIYIGINTYFSQKNNLNE